VKPVLWKTEKEVTAINGHWSVTNKQTNQADERENRDYKTRDDLRTFKIIIYKETKTNDYAEYILNIGELYITVIQLCNCK